MAGQHLQRYAVVFLIFGTLLVPFLVGILHASSPPRLSSIPPRNDTGNLEFIHPLIGSVNGGHVFAGATLPYGMAKACPDVIGENAGGFGSDGSNISGFSGLHDSGVGWTPSMGNFPIFPITSCPGDDPAACVFDTKKRSISYQQDSVVARPGYFAVALDNGVFAEMTVTHHTALYRFTFDQQAENAFGPVLYIELADLQGSRRGGYVTVDPSSGRIQANGTFSPSFGSGRYDVYFCLDIYDATIAQTGYKSWLGPQQVPQPGSAANAYAEGAWIHLQPLRQMTVRVGLSFISNQQACSNAETEIPNFEFESTVEAAQDAWNEKFSVVHIDVQDSNKEMLTVFWTGMYRSLISPQDYTGENQLWSSSEPYFDSYYCIWDTFRTTHPLLTILDQEVQSRMVRALIDIWKHEGRMPDCRMQFSKGFTQGGSNADVVLADSLLKGIANVNWTAGMEAVLADLEPTQEWRTMGRGGMQHWNSIHYIPYDQQGGFGRSVSRTVEYAYDDLCIAQMARRLNHSIADKMLKSSHNWENLFSPDTGSRLPDDPKWDAPRGSHQRGEDTGFIGFLQPRLKNGSFHYQDPAVCSPLLDPNGCYLDARPKGETYEGSVWLYTFLSAPGDMQAVIEKLGGDDTFVRRLDYFHDSGLLYFGDEQSFLTAYMYHYAGRPALSGERVRSYIPSIFNASINGLPGNDDSGAMGAFCTLSMMGLFPNAGQDVYLIIPPFFKSLSLRNKSTGKTATISTVGFDGSHGTNRFIQNATLNGKAWTKSWLRHSFFLDGGTLELALGPLESSWGQRSQDRPPSTMRDGSWDFMDDG